LKPASLLGVSLDLIDVVARPGTFPADGRVGRFTRARRFLGSKDRRFVTDAAFTWLRLEIRGRELWRRALAARGEAGLLPDDAAIRAREAERVAANALDAGDSDEAPIGAIADLPPDPLLRHVYWLDLFALAREGRFTLDLDAMREASRELAWPEDPHRDWAPLRALALAPDFFDGLAAPLGAPGPAEDLALETSLPEWIASALIDAVSAADAPALARSFLEPASIDLRVLRSKKSREHVREHLAAETGIGVEACLHSPIGLRLARRTNLTATTASRQNWIEIQDEGSQIVALACDVTPDMIVIDACAGSGGKTLALADLMLWPGEQRQKTTSRGRIFACDISQKRLRELERRAIESRSMDRIRTVAIFPAGPLPDSIPAADVVLVDAPCTGLGTLRRNPELKRRFGPEDAFRLGAEQLAILERFAPRVKPSGLLVFATCSFLRVEGEDVADAFGARHPEFRPYTSIWARKNLPSACLGPRGIRLDPVRSGTDAFFISAWERSGPATPSS
jgi:16S rRNA (cytosine967-C5)-methyltransferase